MKNNSISGYEKDLEKIGLKLKEIRIAKGFTDLDKFAHENNINGELYNKYEAGTTDITMGNLILILSALNVKISEFFEN